MSNFVYYHYPCPDGVFAALSASLALSNVRWMPITIYSKVPDRIATTTQVTKEDTVYILDYTGGPDFIRACCAAAKEVFILDHHKTALEDCAPLGQSIPNLHITLDMERSGAGLAMDHFQAQDKLKSKYGEAKAASVLRLIQYVQDNDLWRHALPDSKLCALGLAESTVEMDANKNPGLWEALAGLVVEDLVAKGRTEQAKQDAIIMEELGRSAALCIPYGDSSLTALAVVTAYPDYRSVAGNLLAEKSGAAGMPAVGIIAYVEPGLAPGPDGQPLIKVSLRSIGDVDTTPVSQAYAGGGHKNASSFNVARATFDTWWVKA